MFMYIIYNIQKWLNENSLSRNTAVTPVNSSAALINTTVLGIIRRWMKLKCYQNFSEDSPSEIHLYKLLGFTRITQMPYFNVRMVRLQYDNIN